MGIEIDHLSYTSISKYMKCPAQFRFYNENKRVLPTEMQQVGKDIHAEIAELLENGKTWTSKYGERFKKFCRYILKQPTAIEAPFTLDFITNRIVGVIDAYSVQGNQAVIVDWKSNANGSEALQLEIYALAVREKHPEVDTFHGYFYYINQDFYDVKTYFADNVNEISQQLSTMVDRVMTDEKFEAVPGQHCNRCSYIDDCPVAKNFDIKPMNTTDDALEFAKKTLTIEALLDKGKEKIKQFMLEHGLNSIALDGENHYYISTTTALRLGKIKNTREKMASEKVLALAAKGISEKNANGGAAGADGENGRTADDGNGKIIKLPAVANNDGPKVKMGEIVAIMVQLGMIEDGAPSWKISAEVKKILGKNFTIATNEEKAALKVELEKKLTKIAS